MADDGWRWFRPAEKTHLVRGGATTTLCGLDAPGDDQDQTRDHLGVPLPYNQGYCRSCRAAYARDYQPRDQVAASEGDGVVFWDAGDPTDPSERPLRRAGTVEEVPPYKMFEGTRKDTVTVTDRLKVRLDSMTLTSVPLEGRIYAHVSDVDDPEEFRSGGIGEAVAGTINEAFSRRD